MLPRAVFLVAAIALHAVVAAAQAPLSGIVHDSLAKRALAGAAVQVVSADGSGLFSRTVISDSLGRYSIADIPAGRYMLGFLHPVLDSLGMEAPLRQLVVSGRDPIHADLGIPSARSMRTAICANTRAGSASDSAAVIVGVVRDANGGAPVGGVSVIAEWLEMTFSKSGIVRHIPRVVATSGANGWFALCDVPSPGIVSIGANRGGDALQRLDVSVPAERFLRRDLYVRAEGTSDVQTRMTGTVVSTVGGRPIPNAQIRLGDGTVVQTNERGQWEVPDARMGTRMLDVRALGFYPDRHPIDVVPGAPPVQVTLLTLRSVLDTVRITAARIANLHMKGFEERRVTAGVGQFMTADQIARFRATETTELIRRIPGVRIQRSGNPGDPAEIRMRGTFEDDCRPEFFIDNRFVGQLDPGDLDSFVRPGRIAGIEAYAASMAPAEFNLGMGSAHCGVIVIWTK